MPTPLFKIITIHPQFVQTYFSFGAFHSAITKEKAQIEVQNLRQFSKDKHGTIDSRPFGGGDGMVLRPDCLASAVKAHPKKAHVIMPSPCGKKWDQKQAERLLTIPKDIIFICGRFGGVDQRFVENYVDEQFSIGDFILCGGELAALSMIESSIRLIPGVLGHPQSSVHESFSSEYEGKLEHPLYTRPSEFEGISVPKVLQSGNHQDISKWQQEQRLKLTEKLRPDLK